MRPLNRIFVAASLMIVLAWALPAPGGAQLGPPERVAIGFRLDVYYNVINYSDACAWITTYWSYKTEAHWRIEKAQWLSPGRSLGGHIGFNFAENTPQVRILAEVRPTAQCTGSGGTRVTTQRDFKQFPTHPSYSVQLLGSRASGYRFH